MMDWRFEDGTARAAIYPVGPDGEPWCPKDDMYDDLDPLPSWSPTEAQVCRIKGVEEVGSTGAQGAKVIVVADSIEELPTAVARVKTQLQRLFATRYRRHCELAERKHDAASMTAAHRAWEEGF